MPSPVPLFEEVVSRDVLGFSFGGRSYQDQLTDAVAKTKVLCGVAVERKTLGEEGSDASVEVVWVTHNFGFLGAQSRVCLCCVLLSLRALVEWRCRGTQALKTESKICVTAFLHL